jgi:ABC-2 type transport system permease protein
LACLAGLVAQFARSRGMAAAVTAFLMVASLLVTNLASSSRFFSVLSWISPFTAYQASRPLVRGHSVDPWALLVLFAAAVVLWLLAGLAFTRRDLNVAAGRRRRFGGASRGDASGLLRGPFTRDLWSLRGTAITWAIVLSAYLALFISIETMLRKPLEEFLANAGALAQVLKDTLLGSQPIGAVFFGAYAAPILAVYAVLQVSRWAGELDEGLLVSALSTTVSRARLMLSRVGASLVSMAAALAVTWFAVLMVAMLRGVALSGPILARGMAASLVVIVVYLGIGLAVGSWWRLSWAAPVAGAVAAANFVFDIVSQAFHLPNWSTKLSIFARLGNPVLKPLAWNREGVLLLVGLALLGLALLGFQRKDLAE